MFYKHDRQSPLGPWRAAALRPRVAGGCAMRKSRIAILIGLTAVAGMVGCSSPASQKAASVAKAVSAAPKAASVAKAVAKTSSAQVTAAWEKIKPHLSAAHENADNARDEASNRVLMFFVNRLDKTRAFAEEAFSLRSKWELVKSQVGDPSGHQRFLRERFEAVVFSRKELAGVLESAVEEYVQKLRGIENDLLIKVRADLSDDQLSSLRANLSFRSDELFAKEYANSLQRVTGGVARDLGVQIGRETVTWVGADIAASIAISIATEVAPRLGLSAAVLGTGLTSTVATLGIGLVAGIVIDALIDCLLKDSGYDPERDLAEDTEIAIWQFTDVMLFGIALEPRPTTSKMKRIQQYYKREVQRWMEWKRRNPNAKGNCGLRWELSQFADRRERLRNAALWQMISKGDGQ
jgi:hypothetical protein